MPLYVNDQLIREVPSDIMEFISCNSQLKESNERLKEIPSEEIGKEGVLYVCQREFAALGPDTEYIDILGTDDATTCHIVLIRHSGSGVLCLGHLDGSKTQEEIGDMLDKIKRLSSGGPDGRYEVHLIGGFKDDKGTSIQLTCDIFYTLISAKDDLYLMTAFVADINDTIRHSIHYPVIYGLAVRIKTGEMFPATFSDKGPDSALRAASNFTDSRQARDVFHDGLLKVGPFKWFPQPTLTRILSKSNKYIRQNMSTSPEQEPPYFEEHVRQMLIVLRDHPYPHLTLFQNQNPHLYRMNAAKQWTLLDNNS